MIDCFVFYAVYAIFQHVTASTWRKCVRYYWKKYDWIVFILISQWCGVENKYCGVAVESVVEVDACPTTKKEWDNAAELKNCRRLATRQNCSTVDKFKYHCVITSLRNRTVEVCAPEQNISGKLFWCLKNVIFFFARI